MSTFAGILSRVLSGSPPPALPTGACRSFRNERCSLCHASTVSYEDELRAKNSAMQEFLATGNTPGVAGRFVPSPLGREYRTVSKRKLLAAGSRPVLALLHPDDDGSFKPIDIQRCLIEPPGHALIYETCRGALEKPYALPLRDLLSYVVVKGNYEEHSVILNVRRITHDVLRAVNTLSKTLTHRNKTISAVFLYEDNSDGSHYLGTRAISSVSQIRKIFGKAALFQSVHGRKFLFPPLSFSQINQSLVDGLVGGLRQWLEQKKVRTLFDLYCGYGLFSLCLSDLAKRVVGVEVSAASVEAAASNARRQRSSNTRFRRSDITGDAVGQILKGAGSNDAVLLDPPRNGTSAGVIEAIAARRIHHVAHLFCNIEIMGQELGRWTQAGYRIDNTMPYDMFPGTATVEMMVFLSPSGE